MSMGGGKASNAMLAVSKALVVDTSKPSGSIKVRFLDGSMMIRKKERSKKKEFSHRILLYSLNNNHIR